MQIDINRLKKSQLYSEELDINLWEDDDREIFKWFLASLLFGARISEIIAKKTYKTFERYHLLEPKTILESGWDFLVSPIMREGGYVRYDGKTSTKVLEFERHHCNIRAELEAAGTPIGAADMMIAAPARSRKMMLMTNNERHFNCVKGLEIGS